MTLLVDTPSKTSKFIVAVDLVSSGEDSQEGIEWTYLGIEVRGFTPDACTLHMENARVLPSNEVDMVGPYAKANDMRITFRLLDDDDNLYYEGFCDDNHHTPRAICHWGAKMAGATTIQTYRDGAWEVRFI